MVMGLVEKGSRETESLITAQNQTLNTNYMKKNIYNQTELDKCRLYSEEVETVAHNISACKMLAQKDNKRCHDKVCLHLHWYLVKKYGFEVDQKLY